EKMDFKDFGRQLGGIASELDDMLSSHFQKENRILFPTGMQVIEENEWADIGSQFEDIGYCCFTPEVGEVHAEKVAGRKEAEKEGEIPFGTGSLSREQVEAILNSLPVDVTFVDSEDRVKYFSQSKDRIFVRTKAVIGRKVQQCHPQKSVHLVNQILEEFKSGKKDVADFWINMKGRLIYIRYFPVRNQEGEYLGCLEVTQDITDIKGIEGEKRLL
ncbi:MAG: PAS domain-containing protein, partial [Thermoplasmata archaeon]